MASQLASDFGGKFYSQDELVTRKKRLRLTIRTRLPLLALLPVSMLLAGCDDSKNPLSNPEDAKADTRLAGVWRTQEAYSEDMEVAYAHIGVTRDELPHGVMGAVLIGHEKDGTMSGAAEFLLFPTTIGKNTYLNVAPGDNEQRTLLKKNGWKSIAGYVLFRYKIEGDTLLLWKMDPDAKERAIDNKKVKGEIKEGFLIDMNRITDTTENVARFVATAGDDLFAKKAIRFDRVKSETDKRDARESK
jgi:hypothetical protein